MVGSANGRSTRVLTAFLPMKSSRTSTQASRVPKKALRTTTIRETATVSLRAAVASGARTASQNSVHPPPTAAQRRAASGIRTTRLRYRIAVPAASPGRAAAGEAKLLGSGRALSSGRDANRLLHLGHDALLVVKELVLDLAPAAEVVDRELLRRSREVVLPGDARNDRAVPVVGEDLLRLGRVQPIQPLLGCRRRRLRHCGDRLDL